MRARLIHRFDYRYSEPVLLGSHRFCLRPRPHGFQRLITYGLQVSPDPSQLYDLLAAGGDTITRARFLGESDHLTVVASSEVETYNPPLIEACLDQDMARLPVTIGKLNPDLLSNLQGWLPNGQHDAAAMDLAQEALMGSDQRSLTFLQQLVEMIQDRVKYTQRHVGPAWPAGRTLKERVGSCRDLAMLMIECCRSMGLPARFVSGYHLVEPKPERYDLHAWAEVYLQGAGWRGFDPSGQGAVDDRYIPVATSSKSDLTAAISGSFSGPPGVKSTLEWEISAEILNPVSQVVMAGS
ncbi:transglutaminase family protein [Synechococcus sp. HJ21-Hayes]|jgi:transglutaminase-like putative cysteine protease|uniref:transglutaminase family protein n=1 Tax=unclassified Synechococcus TaxID=2626047 RepID=UPI0020CCA929|nr:MULTISPECIES: transglutaminase family protein [unclassified Synechococcus]MCP9831295.1 transglutaminase family protein [Synechococcus sp. JJ3a-Johnson]MCP9853620.1 transglutaminase family protein [Synechococcus sp. HJ21-Hayes]